MAHYNGSCANYNRITMSSLSAYAELARTYDLQHASYIDDHAMYRAIAAEVGDKINVLELGAGTGRIMLPLLDCGHRVTGVDESAEMLDIARAHLSGYAPERYRLICADNGSIQLRESFDLVIIALNTFLHNLSRDEQLSALLAAFNHLREGGRLVIDLPPNDELASQPDDGQFEFEARMIDPVRHTEIEKFVASRVYFASQQQELSYRMFENIGGQLHKCEVSFRLRHVFKHEMELLLIAVGFKPGGWQWFGDYERHLYDEGSPRMIVSARR